MSFETIRCTISRGAFSGERGVEIRLGANTIYDGALPVSYLAIDGRELTETDPPKDRPVAGTVRAQFVTLGDVSSLRLPDGTTIRMVESDLVKLRA